MEIEPNLRYIFFDSLASVVTQSPCINRLVDQLCIGLHLSFSFDNLFKVPETMYQVRENPQFNYFYNG